MNQPDVPPVSTTTSGVASSEALGFRKLNDLQTVQPNYVRSLLAS